MVILSLEDFNVDLPYALFGSSLIWLGSDLVLNLTLHNRKAAFGPRIMGALLVVASVIQFAEGEIGFTGASICMAAYALFFALYAWTYREPLIAYASTASLALTLIFGLSAADINGWILPLIGLAALYYLAGFFLGNSEAAKGWNATLLYSGLGLGTIVASASPFQSGGLEKSIPIAITATFYAAEAFARRNVWLGFPANAFYLAAYFVILDELNVTETQFFTVGAAALGLLMHYLLRRANAKSAAFITGLVSQLVLLGASYIQMVGTSDLKYFFVLFFQALIVLGYGAIVIRSRSLTIAPIGFLALAIVTILYNALKNLSLVFIIGITGLILLGLGILAVVMRERITDLVERFSDWDA